MKKAFFILFILAPIITSCETNENKKEDVDVAIIGKWYWVKQVYRSYTNGQLNNEETYTDFSLGSYFEFGKGGKFNEFSVDQNNREYLGTYRIGEDGTKLFIKRDVDPKESVYIINKLNSSQLIIFWENTVIDGDPKGHHITYKGEQEYTLRKQHI
jgi:hypothetical protein